MKRYAITQSISYATIILSLLLSYSNVRAYTFNSVLKKEKQTLLATNTESTHEIPRQVNTPTPPPQKATPKASTWEGGTGQNPSIKNELYLQVAKAFWVWHCRLTQNEQSHLTKEGWHSFGIDFACDRGQSFPVTAPTRYPYYEVQYIWMDRYLGTYIILKHWDVRYILWHTDTYKSNLKVWQRVVKWQYLWDTNDSWERNSWEHVHVEKWIGRNNISFITAGKNIYSDKLCTQRGWSFCKAPSKKQLALDFAISLIKKYEWEHTKSYLDWDGWSIGYGTKSFPWEVITLWQAHNRMVQHILPKYNEIQDDFPNFDYKKQGALISLYYNCPSGYKIVAKQGVKALPWLCIRGKVNWVWQVLRGLQTRRNEEIKILNQ